MSATLDTAELLARVLSHSSDSDPHRGRSNAGRWVTINAPRALVDECRTALGLPPTPCLHDYRQVEQGPTWHLVRCRLCDDEQRHFYD